MAKGAASNPRRAAKVMKTPNKDAYVTKAQMAQCPSPPLDTVVDRGATGERTQPGGRTEKQQVARFIERGLSHIPESRIKTLRDAEGQSIATYVEEEMRRRRAHQGRLSGHFLQQLHADFQLEAGAWDDPPPPAEGGALGEGPRDLVMQCRGENEFKAHWGVVARELGNSWRRCFGGAVAEGLRVKNFLKSRQGIMQLLLDNRVVNALVKADGECSRCCGEVCAVMVGSCVTGGALFQDKWLSCANAPFKGECVRQLRSLGRSDFDADEIAGYASMLGQRAAELRKLAGKKKNMLSNVFELRGVALDAVEGGGPRGAALFVLRNRVATIAVNNGQLTPLCKTKTLLDEGRNFKCHIQFLTKHVPGLLRAELDRQGLQAVPNAGAGAAFDETLELLNAARGSELAAAPGETVCETVCEELFGIYDIVRGVSLGRPPLGKGAKTFGDLAPGVLARAP
ncbi:unnamed protein product, partial [Prorocentrum cordatum]